MAAQILLSRKRKYLQVALNGTLQDAAAIIGQLPGSDRIIIEAGTPLIKRYGQDGIKAVCQRYRQRLAGSDIYPYIVADMKTMDRGGTEVAIAVEAGASGVVALGSAPIETLDAFIAQCEATGVDAMIDFMNVDFPLTTLRKLKKQPTVVILHRGVDEEQYNRQKQLPLHEIRRIKGNYDCLIAVAGGDTPREVQSAVFNDADIVVIWKSVYQSSAETINLVEGFLKEIK